MRARSPPTDPHRQPVAAGEAARTPSASRTTAFREAAMSNPPPRAALDHRQRTVRRNQGLAWGEKSPHMRPTNPTNVATPATASDRPASRHHNTNPHLTPETPDDQSTCPLDTSPHHMSRSICERSSACTAAGAAAGGTVLHRERAVVRLPPQSPGGRPGHHPKRAMTGSGVTDATSHTFLQPSTKGRSF